MENNILDLILYGGIECFDSIKKHDKIKNEYCHNNNIHLIRIKYDQDIESELTSFLSFLTSIMKSYEIL